jgi:hypothetical protein
MTDLECSEAAAVDQRTTWRPLVEPQRHHDGIRIVVHAGDTAARRSACGESAAWTWLWKPTDVFPPGPVQGASCCPLCLHFMDGLTQNSAPAVAQRVAIPRKQRGAREGR